MASRTDGGNVEARPDAARPGVTVTDPRFPTTLVHVRDSMAQMGDLAEAFTDEGRRRTVRITTPVRVRGRIAHRGGDVTYALEPAADGAPVVATWSARTGSPVMVPARQVAWLG